MSSPSIRTSVQVVRAGLRSAFASGRDGEPLRAAPAPVIAALRRYFASVDPTTFNGASRVVFAWAFSLAQQGDLLHSSATKHYASVYFFADGEEMVAAGSIAPGFSSHLMRLSRSSPDDAWQVDGLYTP